MTEIEELISHLGIKVSPAETSFLTSATHPYDYDKFANFSPSQAWAATTDERIQDLIILADKHEWPFLPPQVQPSWMTLENELLKPEIIAERQVVMKSLLLAVVEKKYDLAIALAFVVDRFMYYYGGTECILRVVDIIQAERPDIPVPPQLMIRRARHCKDKGDLHRALSILNSFINSPPDQCGVSLNWPYKHRYQYDNVHAVCIQIKGQILYNMGLWIDAVHPLMSSIDGFDKLPEKDGKGMSTSYGIASKCLRNVMECDAVASLRKCYPDKFTTHNPFQEAYNCSQKAIGHWPFQALFRSKRFLEGAEALLMATVLDLEADPETQLDDMTKVLEELKASLKEHERMENLESKEEFYEFLKALFLSAVALVYFPYSRYVPLCWVLEELCIALYTIYCQESSGKMEHSPYSVDLMNAALSLLDVQHLLDHEDRATRMLPSNKEEMTFWMQHLANQAQPVAESPVDEVDHSDQRQNSRVAPEQDASSTGNRNTKNSDSKLKTVDKSVDKVDGENEPSIEGHDSNGGHGFDSVDFGSKDSYSAVMAQFCTSEDPAPVEPESDKKTTGTDFLSLYFESIRELDSASTESSKIIRDVGLPVLTVYTPLDPQVMKTAAELGYIRQSVGNTEPKYSTEDSEQTDSVKLASKVDTSATTECSTDTVDRLCDLEKQKQQLDRDGIYDAEDGSLYTTNTTHSSTGSSNLYSTHDSLYTTFDSLWSDSSGAPSEFDIEELDSELIYYLPTSTKLNDETMEFDYASIQQIAQTNWLNMCNGTGSARARLLKYDPVKCIWTSQSTLVYIGPEVNIALKQKGSHRDVYNLSFLHQEEPLGRYVGKRYRREQNDNKRYLQDVMSQMTARYYVALFNQRLSSLKLSADTFTQIQYLPVFHLQIVDYIGHTLDFVNAEPYLEGDTAFVKLTNNYDAVNVTHAGVMLDTAVAFSHFTFVQSRGKLMVVDLQGWMPASSQSEVLYLTDPQLHTAEDQQQLSPFDLRGTGIQAFWAKVHPTCNAICKQLGIDTRRPAKE